MYTCAISFDMEQFQKLNKFLKVCMMYCPLPGVYYSAPMSKNTFFSLPFLVPFISPVAPSRFLPHRTKTLSVLPPIITFNHTEQAWNSILPTPEPTDVNNIDTHYDDDKPFAVAHIRYNCVDNGTTGVRPKDVSHHKQCKR